MKLSIILPVLNERDRMPETLAALARYGWAHEIIVVDGGSTDGTREWLSAQSIARVIDGPRGKGPQANAGGNAATGDVLLFLHADCVPSANAYQQIQQALESGASGGCFLVRFVEQRPVTLKFVAAGINWRTRLRRSATGDQAIFVRRTVFKSIGGCPDWPLFEDVELVRRIKRVGHFVVVPSRVTLSARRYLARGIFRTSFLIYALRFGFWLGVSPFTLKKWFDDVRPDVEEPERAPLPRKRLARCAGNDSG